MDDNYNKIVPSQERYNSINQSFNYKEIDTLKNNIKQNIMYDRNYLKNYFDTYFKKSIQINDEDGNQKVKFKYSNIQLINPLSQEKMSNKLNKSLISPGGIVFDEDNDDIIVFDIFRIRRFQFRDLRVRDKVIQNDLKFYFPVLDSYPKEVLSSVERDRRLLIDLLFNYTQTETNQIKFKVEHDGTDSNSDSNILNYEKTIEDIEDKFYETVVYDETLQTELKLTMVKEFPESGVNFVYMEGDEEIKKIEFNRESFLKLLDKLYKNLINYKNIEKCYEDVTRNKEDLNEEKRPKCNLEYQRELPPHYLGMRNGQKLYGVEDLHYDSSDKTGFHANYLDNRMSPFNNSWNNSKFDGIFSPMITNRDNMVKVNTKTFINYNDFNDKRNKNALSIGENIGIHQNNVDNEAYKDELYNTTKKYVYARKGNNRKIEELSESNKRMFLESFTNYDGSNPKNAQVKKFLGGQNGGPKIAHGYPSIGLNNEGSGGESLGYYILPDEIESSGIGMSLLKLKINRNLKKILFVPDSNNNRIQVFDCGKSDFVYYGQFGNLPLTTYRSLPTEGDTRDRYESIFNTEKDGNNKLRYSNVKCKSPCDFVGLDYVGEKSTDMFGNKCLNWEIEEGSTFKHNINFEVEDNSQEADSEKVRRKVSDLEYGEKNNCINISDDPKLKNPFCIIKKEGEAHTLSRCFDPVPKNNDKQFNEVINQSTCEEWQKFKFNMDGPIELDNCYEENNKVFGREVSERENKCIPFDCNSKYSLRRANIHHRQKARSSEEPGFNSTNNHGRFYGHFYDLVDEYYRIVRTIIKVKEGNADVDMGELSSPHFLGENRDACLGKNKDNWDAENATYDNCLKINKDASGIKNCSLAYRKYIIKQINITNQGQKFGQLFNPKSTAYDKEDNKLYVVDTNHHCIQCFDIKGEKATSSGNLIDLSSADELLNDKETYYYDFRFNDKSGEMYNKSEVYSLGLRQKLIYEPNFIDKLSVNQEINRAGSKININWVRMYGDTIDEMPIMRLFRWISGISKYGNYVFKEFKELKYSPKPKENMYKKIKENKDYYFATDLSGDKDIGGVGEFSYPTDIAISDYTCLNNKQIMFITDSGNNRVSLFKKYQIEGKPRFRFFRFLGDEEDNEVNRIFVNPISVCVSNVSGCVFVLEANLYDNIKNYSSNSDKGQNIKVFYPYIKKGNYYFSHNINLSSLDMNNIEGKKINKTHRITKIRIDDRGILALTDINNNLVHLLRESVDDSMVIQEVNDSGINKLSFKVSYDPYKDLKNKPLKDFVKDKRLLNFDRFRFIMVRQRVCAFQNLDVKLTPEFKIPRQQGNYKNTFDVADYNNQPLRTNVWLKNDLVNGEVKQYFPEVDYIKNDGNYFISNRTNLDIMKTYKNNILYGYEDWSGKQLDPNSSYKYTIGIYNYANIFFPETQVDRVVHSFPESVETSDVIIRNVSNEDENFIHMNIKYDKPSKVFNPICFYIFRRAHNRSSDIVTRFINLNSGDKIQLLLPYKSKILNSHESKPRFGKLKVYDHSQGGDLINNLEDMKLNFDYGDSKYMIFYSCEGGDEKQGGFPVPNAEQMAMESIKDEFLLSDEPTEISYKIKYEVNINIKDKSSNIIILSDNDLIDENLTYYRKERNKEDEQGLIKILKTSFAKKNTRGVYNYPDSYQFCDKGVVINDRRIDLEANNTYEYCIMTANPFKVNPAINSFYSTTRPEKPYFQSVFEDKKVEEDSNGRFKKVKLTWYYPTNRSMYWSVNFVILRKQIENDAIGSPPLEIDVDFQQVSIPEITDKFFRINKKSIQLLDNNDTEGKTFKRNFPIGDIKKFRIYLLGDRKMDARINNIKYNFNELYHVTEEVSNIDLQITLKENQQLINIRIEETFEDDEEVIEEDEDEGVEENEENEENQEVSGNRRQAIIDERKKQKQAKEVKEELEEYRKTSGVNFIFNLSDDYEGYYTQIMNKRVGNNGALYNYIKDFDYPRLYSILSELHDQLKIYHGDVTLRLDGQNGMLRSGNRNMLIQKIRHFAFMLRQQKKIENNALGINCNEFDLNDIRITGTQGADGKTDIKAVQCKRSDVEPLETSELDEENNSSSNSNNAPAYECSQISGKGFRNPPNTEIIDYTLEECCNLASSGNHEGFAFENNTCKIYSKYDTNNIVDKPNSIIGKTVHYSENTIEEVVQNEDNEGIDTNWYIVKNEGDSEITKKISGVINDEFIEDVLKNFTITPTPVSLSGDKTGTNFDLEGTKQDGLIFSSHDHYLDKHNGQYVYKIGVFQTGLAFTDQAKRNFIGHNTDSLLNLGEIYSKEIVEGTQVPNKLQINTPAVIPSPMILPPEGERPKILFFEPTKGTENTVVRIVGIKLNDIDYFSFRDIKVKVLKKQKRKLNNIMYDEYLVKPPSLEELNRKCWQSIEQYKVLVWGFFKGKQIRSNEKMVSENNNKKMFTYINSGNCK